MRDRGATLRSVREAVVSLREADALAAARAALEAGVPPREILDGGLTAAMTEVGRRWQQGRMFVPQVMVAARIFSRCARVVEQELGSEAAVEEGPTVVLATVQGDQHDLGKSIVGAMLRATGFRVHDLGKDVAAARVLEAVREHGAAIVGLSAMLTSTMPAQQEVIEALASAGWRERVRVVVGGAPVSRAWARQIGADGYGADAAAAVSLVRELALG